MTGWHHRLNGHEFEQTLGDGEGQGSLACCSLWGHKELDMTEQELRVYDSSKTSLLIDFQILNTTAFLSSYSSTCLKIRLHENYVGFLDVP